MALSNSKEKRREYTRRYRERHPDKVREASRRYAQKRASQPRVLSDHLCECGCGQYTYLAKQTSSTRNVKQGEPLRYLRGHNPIKRLGGPIITQRYVEEDRGFSTPCWIWQLRLDKGGYGKERNDMAHRVYYERFVGPIPSGYQIDHLCCQRSCVNPTHLEPVTPEENQWRAYMTRMSLDAIQILSLREWMRNNLNKQQLESLWESYSVAG